MRNWSQRDADGNTALHRLFGDNAIDPSPRKWYALLDQVPREIISSQLATTYNNRDLLPIHMAFYSGCVTELMQHIEPSMLLAGRPGKDKPIHIAAKSKEHLLALLPRISNGTLKAIGANGIPAIQTVIQSDNYEIISEIADNELMNSRIINTSKQRSFVEFITESSNPTPIKLLAQQGQVTLARKYIQPADVMELVSISPFVEPSQFEFLKPSITRSHWQEEYGEIAALNFVNCKREMHLLGMDLPSNIMKILGEEWNQAHHCKNLLNTTARTTIELF